jgi:hypothetical protein
MLASLAPPGSPTVDVLVLAPDETVIASLQVKTRHQGRDRGWMMRKKHESIVQDRYFYALVDLEPDSPVVYIVPSAVVADVIAILPGRSQLDRRRLIDSSSPSGTIQIRSWLPSSHPPQDSLDGQPSPSLAHADSTIPSLRAHLGRWAATGRNEIFTGGRSIGTQLAVMYGGS